MSAHSFPSLTSDSSSIPSRSSDLPEVQSNDLPQPAVSSRSSSPHALPLKDPEASSEVVQLRNRVSKLEQDKFVLGDYATELQSRIRQLERERMHNRNAISHDGEPDPREKAQSTPSCTAQLVPSRPRTPTEHSRGAGPRSDSLHQASSSLSASTSTAFRRALSHASSLSKTTSPTFARLAIPSSLKVKLAPAHSPCTVAPENANHTVVDPPSGSVPYKDSLRHTSTPTRRRLQAMRGRHSMDAVPESPPVNDTTHDHDLDDPERSARDTQRTRTYNSMPLRREKCRRDLDLGAKRTVLTSKLDSIVVTSKLFPLPSSRSKAPSEPVSPSHRPQNGYTAVVSLAHTLPSSSSPAGSVFLDSPPRRQVNLKVAKQGNKSLSRSLGLEESRHLDVQHKSDERKIRSRGRVSFSERLFPSPTDRGDEIDTDTETTARFWGSWSRRKRPTPLPSGPKNRTEAAPSNEPLTLSSRVTPRGEDGHDLEEKRHEKRRSLAAGCLRFVSGCSERDKTSTSERRESHALHRSHSESRRSRSHSRSHSPVLERAPRHGTSASKNLAPTDKYEKNRITPLRVGSPKPKARVSDLQQGNEELERASSLRSPGKWGQRGHTFTPEVTRRRTIHPMFSFERPGSAGASTASSWRADDEETVDGHRSTGVRASGEKPSRRTRRVVQAEHGVSSSSHNHGPHIQDDSGASGNTAVRSDSVSTHKGKGQMMRTRAGMQTHGTFAFEPATAVVIPPRSAPPHGTFTHDLEPSSEARAYVKDRRIKAKRETAEGQGPGHVEDLRNRTYLDFCYDLKVVLGNGEEWANFTKYIHRFDIELLTADVLLRRVKELIDGSRSVDQSTKLKLYDRFVSIVKENVNEHIILGS